MGLCGIMSSSPLLLCVKPETSESMLDERWRGLMRGGASMWDVGCGRREGGAPEVRRPPTVEGPDVGGHIA